jgi:hypothetical protein
MGRVAAALKLVVVFAALAGCERADKDAVRTKRVTIENPKVTVKLVDPGRAPHAPLRYRIEPPFPTGTYELATTVHDRWADLPSEPPLTITARLDRKVGDARPDATLDVFTFREVRFDRQPEDPMLQRYTRMAGSTHEQWIDARGGLVGPTTTTLDDRLQPGDYNTDNTPYIVVLPEEPIGVGARWEIEAALPTARAAIRAQLVRREDNLVEIRVTFDHESRAHAGVDRSTGTGDLRLALDGSDATTTYVERIPGTVDGHQVVRELTITSKKVSP